nr:hypothetical protein [Streptomyces solincola]
MPHSASRAWAPPAPYDLARTLRVLRRSSADPTCRLDADGTWWRTSRTPDGPATLRLSDESDPAAGCRITGAAWWPGADWVLEHLPALLDAGDDPTVFMPRHRVAAAAHRRHAGLRLAATGLVMESLIPTVLEQRVTTGSARYVWRRLLRLYGEQPPGPAPAGVPVTPAPSTWRRVSS